MQILSLTNDHHRCQTTFGRAVVIGSSITGLTAARTLADHFAQVTIIERDRLPERADFRQGAPQARHAHILPLRGETIFEQQFPGLLAELQANGAVASSGGSEMAVFIAGSWHTVKSHLGLISLSCSRPLLEAGLYRRLISRPNIRVVQEHEVVGLVADESGIRVAGVRLRPRHSSSTDESTLPADLVLDTSGRGSPGPQGLANLGYIPPRETTINTFVGYARRLYCRPSRPIQSWKTLFVRPTPPHGTRGGVIIPIEGGRWLVTLTGVARDYPPPTRTAF